MIGVVDITSSHTRSKVDLYIFGERYDGADSGVAPEDNGKDGSFVPDGETEPEREHTAEETMYGDSEDEVHAGDRADCYCVSREEAENFTDHPPEIGGG